MAIDTRDKRFSLVSLALPIARVFPNPDGSFSAEDRTHWIYLYRGISLLATTLMALERAIARRISGRLFGRVN